MIEQGIGDYDAGIHESSVRFEKTSLNDDDNSFIISEEEENPEILLVMNDITRLKQLEDMQKEFVANVSHEIRTPVTAIKGFVETLKEGALEERERAHQFLDIIDNHTDRLIAIIGDLLSLSRIEKADFIIKLNAAGICVNFINIIITAPKK